MAWPNARLKWYTLPPATRVRSASDKGVCRLPSMNSRTRLSFALPNLSLSPVRRTFRLE